MPKKTSYSTLIKQYRHQFALTWTLVLFEGITILILPILIGISIDDLLKQNYTGLRILIAICTITLFTASARRWYDTRAYAKIFREIANKIITQSKKNNTTLSAIIARIKMLSEVIEYSEESIPDLINRMISFFGIIIIVGCIDLNLLWGFLFSTCVVVIVYVCSEKLILSHNTEQNDELELQANIIEEGSEDEINDHFNKYMKWKIKLSDQETYNYSIIWIVLVALLVYSIIRVVYEPSISYGLKVTCVLYIFEYIDVIMALPLNYQKYIRLKEIMSRLEI